MHLIHKRLNDYTTNLKSGNHTLWESRIYYDFELNADLLNLTLLETIESCKPFGNGFEEPRFIVAGHVEKFSFLNNKLTGEAKHSQVFLRLNAHLVIKVMFFNEVLCELEPGQKVTALVSVHRNVFRGVTSISYFGSDIAFPH